MAADAADPHGLARPIATVLSSLDPNAMPTELLTTDSVVQYIAQHRTGGAMVEPPTAAAIRRGLASLNRLNVTATQNRQGGQTIRMHALTQRAVREDSIGGALRAAQLAAADGLVAIWPTTEPDLAYSAVLRS